VPRIFRSRDCDFDIGNPAKVHLFASEKLIENDAAADLNF